MRNHPQYRRLALLAMGAAVLVFLVRPMYANNSEVGIEEYQEIAYALGQFRCLGALDEARRFMHDTRLTVGEARMVRAELESCRVLCGVQTLRDRAEGKPHPSC